MKIICSPSGIIDPSCPDQGAADIADAGFENISLELDVCCSPGETAASGKKDFSRFFEKMLEACRSRNLEIFLMTAPHLPRDTKGQDLIPVLKDLSREAIRFCGSLGCRYLVVRPLTIGRGGEEQWRINRDYYLDLAGEAKEHGVMILLENQFIMKNGQAVRSVCSDEGTAARWVDRLNEEAGEERFGFCMNVEACILCGQMMYEVGAGLGERIKAVILKDCDGYHEGAMLPFTSVYHGQPRTDWSGLIRGLGQAGFDGGLILDICDTASVFPAPLRPRLMVLAKEVAEYFKTRMKGV